MLLFFFCQILAKYISPPLGTGFPLGNLINQNNLESTQIKDHEKAKYESSHLTLEIIFICKIGPSGLRALPLAAGINIGGHYFKYFFHSQKGLS